MRRRNTPIRIWWNNPLRINRNPTTQNRWNNPILFLWHPISNIRRKYYLIMSGTLTKVIPSCTYPFNLAEAFIRW